jgi:regulator of protease activity HflC (stomatin/prohibitin superfamily)
MNEINAATRLRAAAMEKGEAEKTLLVKKAEAESESKALQGKGIAQQRIEIARGMQESLNIISRSVEGRNLKSEEIMSMLLVTQYFDTLKSLGGEGNNTIFVSTAPSAPADLQSQIIGAIKSSTIKK